MDSQLVGVITLLRSALKNEALTLPQDFDWHLASNLLYEHHLVPLGIRGAARCGVPRTDPALRHLTALFCKDVAVSRLQMQKLEKVYALFQEQGFDYMPVKGAVLKPLYPQSELRAMGDADLLIRQEQYPAIRELLLAQGMREEVESDHEFVWKDGDFKLELHKRLIPTYNRDYCGYYGDGWHLARHDGGSHAWYLSPEDHFIYLLVHFAKHYRDGSISAKSICDFWVYRKAYPEMDGAYLIRELDKLKLTEFYRNILDLLDTWFEGAEPTNAVELLTHTAFRGGILSAEESSRVFAVMKQNKARHSILVSKLCLLLSALFPPVRVMANRYPALRKFPLLLPVFWFIRGFEILFLNPERRKYSLDASRNILNVDTRQLTEYEQKLRAVGLDYHTGD